jgi:hypothetical protein
LLVTNIIVIVIALFIIADITIVIVTVFTRLSTILLLFI